ncbi:Tep6, partial [Cordylochernes scorpioides]
MAIVAWLWWAAVLGTAWSQQQPNYNYLDNSPVTLMQDRIRGEPSYLILASRTIRPGQVYRVLATVYRTSQPITVRASLQRDGVELASTSQKTTVGVAETLLLKMALSIRNCGRVDEACSTYVIGWPGIALHRCTLQVPATSVAGSYRLRVEGNVNSVLGGTAFHNETELEFSQRSMTIFIQTDQPIYKQGQTVKFRTIPIGMDLKAFPDAIDVYMLDPGRQIMRRWLSRQSNFGAVSLEYDLSIQPTYGKWSIQVVAQVVLTDKMADNVCYTDQTLYEVNVTMPEFFMDTDKAIQGTIMANYTSGAPVVGNLSLEMYVEPYRPFQREPSGRPLLEQYFRVFVRLETFDGVCRGRVDLINGSVNMRFDNHHDWVKYNASAFVIKTGSTTQCQADLASREMAASHMRNGHHVQPLLTWSTNAAHPVSLRPYRVLSAWPAEPRLLVSLLLLPLLLFHPSLGPAKAELEHYDFVTKCCPVQRGTVASKCCIGTERRCYVQFEGYLRFQFPTKDLRLRTTSLDRARITVRAVVGERYLNRIEVGHGQALVFTSTVSLRFLGASPQVFKPFMPFKCYIVASYQDGTPLPDDVAQTQLELRAVVNFRDKGIRRLDVTRETMTQPGVWEVTIDLPLLLGDRQLLRNIEYLSLEV